MAEPCTRGRCSGCGRLVAYARTVGSGVPVVFEADATGSWRPAERDRGPMRYVGRAGGGSYRLHEPVCAGLTTRERSDALTPEPEPERVREPAPRLFLVDGAAS